MMNGEANPAHENAVDRVRRLQSEKRSLRNALMTGVMSAYFGSTRDRILEGETDELIDSFLIAQDAIAAEAPQPGRLGEGRALVVVGDSGAGKTRALQRLFSKREEFAGPGNGGHGSILVSVCAPSPCTLRLLGQTVLDALGYVTDRQIKENVVWDLVRRHMELQGVHFLHIDEFQHVVQTRNPVEIQKVRDTLKGLMQNPGWPVWLILSGLPEVAEVIEGDTQIRRRCRFIRFDALTLERDSRLVERLITYYGHDKAGLSVRGMASDEMVSRLLHASLGQFGIAVEFIQDATKQALKDEGGTLEVRHFAEAYAARTGCPPDANVFTAMPDWTSIDVRTALYPAAALPPDEPKRKAPRDRRNP